MVFSLEHLVIFISVQVTAGGDGYSGVKPRATCLPEETAAGKSRPNSSSYCAALIKAAFKDYAVTDQEFWFNKALLLVAFEWCYVVYFMRSWVLVCISGFTSGQSSCSVLLFWQDSSNSIASSDFAVTRTSKSAGSTKSSWCNPTSDWVGQA